MQRNQKVLLINPFNPQSDHIQPPLGLGYLATAIRKINFSVKILDANKERIKPKELEEIIKQEKPNFVGLQSYSANFHYVKESLKFIKEVNPEIVTLVGGPHPSALPRQILETMGDSLDFAFAGEAEIGLPKLLGELLNKTANFASIPGLIYRQKGKIVLNPPLFLANLDLFDFPAWDLLKPETYPEAQHGAFFEKFPIAPIVTTRGCPYNCSFCAGKLNTGKIFRKRSLKNVLLEIKFLYNKHGIREFHIVDDNFTFEKDFAKEILREVIKLKLNASFAVPNGVRIDSLDEELINLMKKAGFYLISIGIESGSDRVLNLMNKNITTAKIQEKISLINQKGLNSAGFFIIGYPGETENEINKTIDFSLNLGLSRANYFLFLPLPGTPIFAKLKKEGLIKNNLNFSEFSFTRPFLGKEISQKKLKKLQRKAFLKFYFFRPKVLLKNLFKIKRPQQLIFLIRRAFRWIF